MRNLLCTLCAVLTLAACSNLETVETRDDLGRLTERFTVNKETGAREGKYQAFYPDGALKEEAWYRNGSLHGVRKRFYENGNLDFLETYVNGHFEGLYQKYYPNGQLANEGQYIADEMTGTWRRWYESGELMEEVHFEHNLENGPYRFYHKNGQISTEGTFIQGDNDHGELLLYDEQGRLIEKMYCYWGVCATTWRADKGELAIDTARIRSLGERNRSLIERELGMK
ncbi:MAG: hypothetical protein KatS3mg029_0689 [Saprospiraceae bacterium]|nr:MAG: hypothetical protein KatS3mg029_0689 [Saprospiraceae bacterium]